MNDSRKKMTISIVALMLLVFMIIGASVAYFIGQVGTGATADINAITGTTDSLMFKVGDPINILANMSNFKEGEGNVNSTTYANATLIANNGTNQASYNYNLYLDIIYNDLVYTTSDKKPELLLKITTKDNSEDTNEEATEITSGITGLEYKTITTTSGTYSGFDITERQETVEIALNHEISTTSRKTNNWEIEVIFVNLDSDQQLNTEKVFRSELRIGTEELEEKQPTLADVCIGRNMAECFKENYQLDSNIYLHDSNLANSAEDGSYRYAGGDSKLKEGYEQYNAIKEISACFLIDSDGNPTEIVGKGTDGSMCAFTVYYTLNDEHATDIEKYFDIVIKTNFLGQEFTEEEQQFAENFQQIIEEQQALGNNMICGIPDNAYNQYVKNGGTVEKSNIIEDTTVKNYVCFGSDEETCPDDNLYRIIGVFGNNVKLIKADYATSALLETNGDYHGIITPDAIHYKGSQTTLATYYWNASTEDGGTYNNNWNESRLNTINLNTNYLNNIGPTWSEKIEEVNWNIGGHTTRNATAKTFYDAEKTSTYKAKIGLITISEYGYATIPSNWTTNLETDFKNNNWMYMGHGEWSITRDSDSSYIVFYVSSDGNVYLANVVGADSGVRPSFSLKSSITYVDGSGTKTDPIRIN